MKRALRRFSHWDTMAWFEEQGVRLVTQDDECVFPVSQDAMEIVRTLEVAMRREGVVVRTRCRITSIVPEAGEQPSYLVSHSGDTEKYDAVVVTTGGSPKASGLDFLRPLALEIIPPMPSLFSFNIADKALREMMGQVVEDAGVALTGTRFRASGPLLITHWGMSGPAILRLSSYAARHLGERNYKAQLSVNWLGDAREEDAAQLIRDLAEKNPQKLVTNAWPESLPSRLWAYLLAKCEIPSARRYAELGSRQQRRLASALVGDLFSIDGQSRHKEEFVTSGGVALSNIDISTMEARQYPNLFLAGEVLDVDAITGGFNLQAAWSMGWIIAQEITQKTFEA